MHDNAPVFNGYRIYPRGFLGENVGMRVKDTLRPFNAQLQTHQFHPDFFKSPNPPAEVNWNVEELWQHMLKKAGATLDFHFREKIYKIAMTAFGTMDFFQWVRVQLQGPSTGDLHTEFILDTLNFISTGKRHVGLHNWTGMLTLQDLGTNVSEGDAIAEWFRCAPCKTDMVSIIQQWCSHEGGTEDLCQAMHVMFGAVPNLTPS